MSVLTAAVVLAWGCLVILTLAMAGMLRQLRELQAEVVRLGTPQPDRWRGSTGRQITELAGEGVLMLLVLDPGCSFCDTVHTPFTRLAEQHPDTRFEVLSPRDRWPGSPEVRSRVDQGLVAELELPWAPALVLADSGGTVLATQPVQSPDRLDEQVTSLLQTDLTVPQARGAS
ncbi:MAG TPA: hypothetical protein VHH34_02425 [Pseudonocardiaceae bacterium]|nr:hypothetical protein [Pseudonocardiaceae bacterium]